MKYVIVIPDGCADEPIDALGGRTPLQAAHMPASDALARGGVVALSNNTPAHLPAGSEVANLCLLGYDPDIYFTGRAPLEAAAQGITLGPDDWAVRCNLVTIENQSHGRLHRRPYQHRRGDAVVAVGPIEPAGKPAGKPAGGFIGCFATGVRAGGQLPQLADLSGRAGSSRPVFDGDSDSRSA